MMDEPKDTLDMSYEEARENVTKIRNLLTSEGWEFALNVLGSREVGLRTQLANARVTSQEEVAAFNFTQGQLNELVVFPQMLAQMEMDLDAQIKKMQDDAEAMEEESDDVR